MVDVLMLAKYLIDSCTKEKHPITYQKLQLMLYVIQMYWLQEKQKELFQDAILAYQYGPGVERINTLYKEFKEIPLRFRYDTSFSVLTAEELEEINQIRLQLRDTYPITDSENFLNFRSPWYSTYYASGDGSIIDTMTMIMG